jgi:hypothetical protein
VPPPEYGGFLGIADSPNSDALQFWLAGTFPAALNTPPSVATTLVADGQWHHYEIDITEFIVANQLTGTHLMLEDWLDLGSVPGDVYFDNVQVVGVLQTEIFHELVPCAGPAPGVIWRNHGHYVSSMSLVVETYLAAGLITCEEADAIVSTAAKSNCGKRTIPKRMIRK